MVVASTELTQPDPNMHISGFAAPGNGVGAGAMRSDYRTTTSEVFGIVNIYPEGVLEQAAEELGLI